MHLWQVITRSVCTQLLKGWKILELPNVYAVFCCQKMSKELPSKSWSHKPTNHNKTQETRNWTTNFNLQTSTVHAGNCERISPWTRLFASQLYLSSHGLMMLNGERRVLNSWRMGLNAKRRCDDAITSSNVTNGRWRNLSLQQVWAFLKLMWAKNPEIGGKNSVASQVERRSWNARLLVVFVTPRQKGFWSLLV